MFLILLLIGLVNWVVARWLRKNEGGAA
jgi:hypothetical protein